MGPKPGAKKHALADSSVSSGPVLKRGCLGAESSNSSSSSAATAVRASNSSTDHDSDSDSDTELIDDESALAEAKPLL